MPTTEAQVAALRAHLAGDQELHQRLFRELDRAEVGKEYSALITAAFAEAVQRRFGKNYTQADIVTFVGDARSRSERIAQAFDPAVAERLINAVLGDASTQGLDREAKVSAQILLLTALVVDEHLEDAGLDAFLTDARKLADQILSG